MCSRYRLGNLRNQFLCSAMIIAMLNMPARANAGFLFELTPSSSTISPGQSVDVTVQLATDASGGGDIYGFTADVFLNNPPAGLAFTNAQMPSTNYIFQGNSLGFGANPLDASGNPLTSFPAPGLAIFDVPNSPAYVTLSANQVVNLGVLTITAASNTPSGIVPIQFNTAFTQLNSATGLYTFNTQDGQVSVPGGITPTPIPSTGLLALTCVLVLLFVRAFTWIIPSTQIRYSMLFSVDR